jgi:hypothetical protein
MSYLLGETYCDICGRNRARVVAEEILLGVVGDYCYPCLRGVAGRAKKLLARAARAARSEERKEQG